MPSFVFILEEKAEARDGKVELTLVPKQVVDGPEGKLIISKRTGTAPLAALALGSEFNVNITAV